MVCDQAWGFDLPGPTSGGRLTDARPPPALPDPSPGSVLGTSDLSWDGSHRLFRELAMGLAERQRARSTAIAF